MSRHLERMARLVVAAGGEVSEGLFVERPGVRLIAATALTPEARALFDDMLIDTARPDYEQLAELNSRITYLSFRDRAEVEPGSPGPAARPSSEAFNRKMVEELGHLSVHSAQGVTFLIAGISVETCQELVAHHEGKVARLTSSRTRAMDRPLFRVQGPPAARAIQRQQIKDALFDGLEDDGSDADLDDREWRNRLLPGAKAVALTWTMSIKDFHKTFIGRLSQHGVEFEVREVCEMVCAELHARYPLVIKAPAAYYAMGNAAKYEGD